MRSLWEGKARERCQCVVEGTEKAFAEDSRWGGGERIGTRGCVMEMG